MHVVSRKYFLEIFKHFASEFLENLEGMFSLLIPWTCDYMALLQHLSPCKSFLLLYFMEQHTSFLLFRVMFQVTVRPHLWIDWLKLLWFKIRMIIVNQASMCYHLRLSTYCLCRLVFESIASLNKLIYLSIS